MRKLLNTLFVTTEGAYLARDGEQIVVKVEGEVRLRLPVHTVGGVVCFGRTTCSPHLLRLCGENDVAVSFLSTNGRFYARLQSPVSGNVLLRREQFRRADDPQGTAAIAQAVVVGKLVNCRTVLRRGAREHGDVQAGEALSQAADELTRVLDGLARPADLDTLRGREGEGSRVYFGAFDHLIASQKDAFRFAERSRRPPLDNVNALLSFVYTLLAHDVGAALQGVGLDPQVGFLHRDRPGRPGLALDLMEELRPVLGDRLVLSLINRRQVQAGGLRTTESRAVTMDDSTRKKVLVAYQERKRDTIRHPFLEEAIEVGLLPHVQALLLARHLRGDLDGYPPFLWR
jgi:CRISPR-associated protein Cas1